jgi:squalene-associated FAD-dependent desaturase
VTGRVHIVGGGLAGLAAALELTGQGRAVTIYEAGPVCGGRCRSYFDKELGVRLDNGNHLLLSGNDSAMRYLGMLGTRDTLAGPAKAVFPFIDLRDGTRWALRLNDGRLPLWLFDRASAIPGVKLRHFLGLLKLRSAGPDDTVAALLPASPLAEKLIDPLAIAALNTLPDAGSARLLWAVVAETLVRGGRYCRPLFPREGLSESFVDPAIALLGRRGTAIHTGCRIARLVTEGGRVAALAPAAGGDIAIAAEDRVILAVPPHIAPAMLPGLTAPDAFESILNVHFRFDAKPGEAGLVGLVGGLAEWVFVKPGVVSVTISAANRYQNIASRDLAEHVWPEVAASLDIVASMPPWRVIREKRATFAATPAQQMRRPFATTRLPNLVLAGDWTHTGLPATIEGAIRSGFAAVHQLCVT